MAIHPGIVALGTPEALKAKVEDDRIELRTDDSGATIDTLKSTFGIEATTSEANVVFRVADGEEFVPRLFSGLGTAIRSISITRPTLDDVFLAYTGRTIRDSEATNTDRMRRFAHARGGQGR